VYNLALQGTATALGSLGWCCTAANHTFSCIKLLSVVCVSVCSVPAYLMVQFCWSNQQILFFGAVISFLQSDSIYSLTHATVYMFLHNLLNVLVQIANEMGLQTKILCITPAANIRWVSVGIRYEHIQDKVKRLCSLVIINIKKFKKQAR
jgi:hypothetical protein